MANTDTRITQMAEINAQIKEALSVWKDMGYDSQQEAMSAASRMFRALYETGHFRSRDIAENLIRAPRTHLMGKYMF